MFEKVKLFFKIQKTIKNVKKILETNEDKLTQVQAILENIKADITNLMIIMPELKDLCLDLLEQIKDLKK